ncbi:MAG: chromate transporter [Thermoleophilaceae bacterium]|nr:chromate transporter [Thermoleophilaceae bacterium]
MLPPFLIVTAVAVLYARYQGLPIVQDLFFGVGPAVMAIVAIASVKLSRATNGRDALLWVISVVLCLRRCSRGRRSFGCSWRRGRSAPFTTAAGCPVGWLVGRGASIPPPCSPRSKGLALTGAGVPLGALALFFAKARAFTFGSELAIVPFLHEGLVEDFGWLSEREFVDAVAIGLLSPGPVVIMATFAGYLAFGLVGAVVATAAVFLPVWVFVVAPGRLVRRYEQHPRFRGFVRGRPPPRPARSPGRRSCCTEAVDASSGASLRIVGRPA